MTKVTVSEPAWRYTETDDRATVGDLVMIQITMSGEYIGGTIKTLPASYEPHRTAVLIGKEEFSLGASALGLYWDKGTVTLRLSADEATKLHDRAAIIGCQGTLDPVYKLYCAIHDAICPARLVP